MKKMLCALMVCVLLCGVLAAACAETLLAYVTGGSLKVYQNPDATTKVLGTLRGEDVVTVLAVKDGWCRIRNGKGAIGYAQKSGLEKVWTGSAKGYVVADSLAVYASNSTSSKRLGTLHGGETVTVVGATGAWCQLKNPSGAIGYCLQSGLSKTNPNTGKCWISHGGLVYIYADSSAEKHIGTAGFGQSFTVVGSSELWVCVQNDKGQTGYIDKEYVTKENPFKQRRTVYTQTSGKLLYAFGTGKATDINLAKNTALTWLATSADGQCCIVEYRGVKYYVKQPKLLNVQKSGGDEIYQVTTATNIYPQNSATPNTARRLNVGEQLRILGNTSDGHYKVQLRDGTVGYCMSWAWKRVQ